MENTYYSTFLMPHVTLALNTQLSSIWPPDKRPDLHEWSKHTSAYFSAEAVQ